MKIRLKTLNYSIFEVFLMWWNYSREYISKLKTNHFFSSTDFGNCNLLAKISRFPENTVFKSVLFLFHKILNLHEIKTNWKYYLFISSIYLYRFTSYPFFKVWHKIENTIIHLNVRNFNCDITPLFYNYLYNNYLCKNRIYN